MKHATAVCVSLFSRLLLFNCLVALQGQRDVAEHGPGSHFMEDRPLCSSAPASPWGHSLYALIPPLTGGMLPRGRRNSPAQHKNVRFTPSGRAPPAGYILAHKSCMQRIKVQWPVWNFCTSDMLKHSSYHVGW